MSIQLKRREPDPTKFNPKAALPYELRLRDFEIAMQDVYDFFYDVNSFLLRKGLQRLDDMLRRANLSGLLSDMLTASLAKHSRTLTENKFHNGHPDLIVKGVYPHDSVKSGDEGIEIKSTLKKGGSVDFHGARNQCLCICVYEIDSTTEPAVSREPLKFTEIYLATVRIEDFQRRERGELGTRTSNLKKEALLRIRENWVYKD